MSRLLGGMQTWDKLVPHRLVAAKNAEGYLGCRDPPEETGALAPHHAPYLRVSMPEREVSITFGCENRWGLWLSETEGCRRPRQFLLKGPCTDLLTDKTSLLWGSSSKSTQVRTEEELNNMTSGEGWGWGWVGNFLLDRIAGRNNCSFVELSPQPQPAGVGRPHI